MTDMERRTVLAGATAALASAAVSTAEAADKGPTKDVKIDHENMTPEHLKMMGIRFKGLEAESHLDFVTGFRRVMGRQAANREASTQTEKFLRSKGMSTLDDTDLPHEEAWNLITQEQTHAARLRLMSTIQTLMWDRASRALHVDRKELMAALEKSDKSGPGKLELNPNLVIPEYARHEIHQQPGGYVGDPLGGFVYHHAVTQGFRGGTADHDENHIEYTQKHLKPADGLVKRVLDIACGTGQSTTPMKLRFPDAEVWGLEVGAPMVRYAHYRAAKMGLEVNFRHGLVEESGFPDNHFCMVTEHLMFHEVAVEEHEKIVREIFRVLRPGGVFSHHDLLSEGNPNQKPSHTVTGKAQLWETTRHNNYEPHYLRYSGSDFPGLLRKVGFVVSFPDRSGGGGTHVYATKPV